MYMVWEDQFQFYYLFCQLNFIYFSFTLCDNLEQKCTGCPKNNVPLGEGQTSPKGTFFLGHLVDLNILEYFFPPVIISYRIGA